MEAFKILEGIAAPLEMANVDTGQILPARFLRRPRQEGFQDFLFRDMRFDEAGQELPSFILNRPPYRATSILVADRNFGAGSSREQAAWALVDFGIRCVIAKDFGDIFHANAFKAGLLPVRLDLAICRKLREQLAAVPGRQLRIDLPAQHVTAPDGSVYPFEVDAFRKRCLVEGLDDIGLTLQYDTTITAFEQAYRQRFDWLFRSHPNAPTGG
ncbi:3-isopropylmalate dehydratase small subunit [Xylophilus sp. GW821-FHT01B05]